jgi:hypothetical protein
MNLPGGIGADSEPDGRADAVTVGVGWDDRGVWSAAAGAAAFTDRVFPGVGWTSGFGLDGLTEARGDALTDASAAAFGLTTGAGLEMVGGGLAAMTTG